MKRLWSHQDGRLKIGSVSIALFVMLLALAGGLMQLNQPVDEALVQVKHIFRAEANIVPERVEEPSPQLEPVKAEPPAAAMVETTAVSETKAGPDLVAETVLNPPVGQQQNVEVELVQTTPVTVNDPATVRSPPLVAEAAAKPETASAAAGADVPVAKDPFRDLRENSLVKKVDQPLSTVTVTPKQYQEVFSAWRSAENEQDAEASRPGLLVENLRQLYPLFQMKPVALAGGIAYDLEDGSRLAERSLERYTATVFQVERPWDDWGEALRRIGLHPGDVVKVRYYMHGYVHNGIYGRCEQAIAWGKGNGLLPEDVKTAEVEVRGRAYAVRQQGGGQFGVFIPNQLRLLDGQVMSVNLDAFDGAADVELLKAARVL